MAWIARWGFPFLVGAAALGSGYLAWKVAVPEQVPAFALQAEAIYRIEVGAAAFLGLYLVTMAFVLALHNRAFSEIGVNGMKAQDMADTSHQDAIRTFGESLVDLEAATDEVERSSKKSIRELMARLETLEAER